MSGRPLADTQGSPVAEHIDPTANVLALTDAASRRQDDLRAMSERLVEARIDRINAELKCLKGTDKLRARMLRDQQVGEKGRLDSIRQVDLSTFNTTVTEIRSAVKALADVTTATAQTLQSRVDATAATLAKAGADQIAEVMKRIAALELAAAQGLGKQAVSDPQYERLAAVVDSIAKAQQAGAGERRGIGSSWAVLMGGASLVFTLMGIAGVLYAVLKP